MDPTFVYGTCYYGISSCFLLNMIDINYYLHNYQFSFHSYQNYPIIISPNLGIPTIISQERISELNTGDGLEAKFNLNIIASENETPEQVMNALYQNIFLIPLFQNDEMTHKMRRGEPIFINVENIEHKRTLHIAKKSLRKLYNFPKSRISYILYHEFFGKSKVIFFATVNVLLPKDSAAYEYYMNNRYLMFDLYQDFSFSGQNLYRINYHSVALRNASDEEIIFTQITDLHLSQRCDNFLTTMHKSKIPYLSKIAPKINQPPLIERFHNPNNLFRQFICYMNKERLNSKMDCIFITGDIIDYFYANSGNKVKNYDIETSNWMIFLNILLNNSNSSDCQTNSSRRVSQEELTVPIFTLTGNHEQRINGYSMDLNYHNFGISKTEAKLFQKSDKQSTFKSLVVDKMCLMPYYQFINPFDDYFVNFGSNCFIMLNSGSEAYSDIRSSVFRHPSCKGFSDKQMAFVKNVGEKIIENKNNIGVNFLLSHAPIINPAAYFSLDFRRYLENS